MRKIPDPTLRYPRPGETTTCYLKNVIKNPNIIVGDFTIYHDFNGTESFETKNVLYHYPINNDKLIIGKFCSIACGARFLMNGCRHTLNSFSTYPFPVFPQEWDDSLKANEAWDVKGDTVIGNDVWIGYEAVILPGSHIGDGAIVAARAVVSGNVPPYSIVGGVPARLIRKRFPESVIDILCKLQWWNWPSERISEVLPILRSGDPKQLSQLIHEK
jgi:virginiamycin A acetyltransferase